MDQPGKVANPAMIVVSSTGKMNIPLSRVSLFISILRLNLVLAYGISPEFQ